MKTAIVTGGAGFIGSHLCDALLNKGIKVVAIDNLITGNLRNIAHLRKNKKFKFVKFDVSNHFFIKDKVDYVLHFAALASPADYIKYPIQSLKVGSLGTHNALGLARKKNAKILLASTSECYGDPLLNPQKESYWGNVNPIGPRGCYDEAKRFAEAITMAYYRSHNLNTSIVRIFNTYGPRMRKNDGRVIPNFINQALKNKPMTVYGKGKQTRSLCYISDLVDGILKLLFSKEHLPVNLGNPNEMTILDLAKKIKKLTNSKSKIIFKNLPEDDPKVRRPDIGKAKKILKWKPKVNLEQGLSKTIDFFKV